MGERADGTPAHVSRIDRLARASALVSGLLLASIMVLTVVDVTLRYVFNAPLVGGQELTELAMVALIVFAMPYCAATDGHVRVDVLESHLPPALRRAADAVTSAIALVVLGFLVWRTVLKAEDTWRYQDLTNLLELPLWPIYSLIALGFAGYALIVARDLARLLHTPSPPHE